VQKFEQHERVRK